MRRALGSLRATADDRGLGGAEVLPLTIAVLAAGTLAVAGAWGVIDGRGAVSSATAEAVRAFVAAPDELSAGRDARRAAQAAMEAAGGDPQLLELDLQTDSTWGRCVRVTAVATYPVSLAATTVTVRGEHAGVVDPWRDGLTGEGCG